MKIALGLVLVITAIWGILDATGVVAPIASAVGDIYIVQILLSLIVLVFIVKCITKRWIPVATGLTSVLFMIIEPNIAVACGMKSTNIINNWLLLGLTTVLCFGLWLVIPRKKSFKKQVGDKIGGKVGEKIAHHGIGAGTVYIDSGAFEYERVENSMGNTVVRFENPDLYLGNGTLEIENNMGAMQIFVPMDWCIDMRVENNMGAIPNYPADDGDGPLLTIVGENNMGSVGITRM